MATEKRTDKNTNSLNTSFVIIDCFPSLVVLLFLEFDFHLFAL